MGNGSQSGVCAGCAIDCATAGSFVVLRTFARFMVTKGPSPPISTKSATRRMRKISTLSMSAPVSPASVCA